jgi:hypothetical protein
MASLGLRSQGWGLVSGFKSIWINSSGVRLRKIGTNYLKIFEPGGLFIECKETKLKEASKKIPMVILPEGYNGKILLVSIAGVGTEKMVILRSGDLWHREILRNTEAEIRNLGFRNARLQELGGAHLRFEPDGTIIIHGTSQQFGACDKKYAAKLLRNKFPGRRVDVRP